jgi:threonine dehydrogenase-like Zn-dependent dehydrogenase
MSLLAAKAAGATVIVIADIKEDRLAVAKQLGATLTVNATSDVKEAIKNAGIHGIDVCIECSGAEPAIRTAIRVTRYCEL